MAIVQRVMHWGIHENVGSAVSALAHAAQHGTHLCVFPELSITGYHRKIGELCVPSSIAGALLELQNACRQYQIAAVVGAPVINDGQTFNSSVFVDRDGIILGEVSKNGLTTAEATLFAAGSSRPAYSLCGHRCSAVLCREVEDIHLVTNQLANSGVGLIFWPGIMRPDPQSATCQEPYIDCARRLAVHLNAYVVQANWPNSLNYPAEGAEQGRSIVIAPTGQTLLRLPKAESGIGIFSLGSSQFDWYPDHFASAG